MLGRRRWVTYEYDALYVYGLFGRGEGADDRRWFWLWRQTGDRR